MLSLIKIITVNIIKWIKQDMAEGAGMREIFGYFLLVSGLIGCIIFDITDSIMWLVIGIGLLLTGIILVLNPSREYVSMITEILGMISISVGVIITVFGITIFKYPLTVPIGVGLLLLGLILLPGSSREKLIGFIGRQLRTPGGYRREREILEERPVPKKKPKGFSRVKKKEYKKIPKDAIDPFTHHDIHDLIAQGKSIIRCRDCGAYYDKEVWEHYGKICVRIGCSNAEV